VARADRFKKGSAAGARAGDRDDRDRRRRRLDRARRSDGPPEGRARQRRGHPGPACYNSRAPAHRGRRRPAARLSGRRVLPWGAMRPRPPGGAARGRGARGPAARLDVTEAAWAFTAWSTRTWRPPRAFTGSSGARIFRSYPLFAFGGAGPPVPLLAGRDHPEDATHPAALRRGRDVRVSACWPRRWRSISCARSPAARRRRLGRHYRSSPRWKTKAGRCSREPAWPRAR